MEYREFGAFERAYSRLVKSCLTPNQNNRLNIMLETYLTAEEWRRIERVIRRQYGVIVTWLARQGPVRVVFGRYLPKSKFYSIVTRVSYAHKFSRKDLRRNRGFAPLNRDRRTRSYSLFLNPENSTKSLFVIWVGGSRRPMMPLSIFLEGARPLGMDVLVLRPSQDGYKSGVRGFGDTLPESVLGLSKFVSENNYENVYCQGQSLGTLPALLSSTLPKVRTVLIAGPASPQTTDPIVFGEFIDRLKQLGIRPKVSIAVGSNAPKDISTAESLGNVFETNLIIVRNARHTPPWVYARKGKLYDWLSYHHLGHAERKRLRPQ
jgi:hypothetical protein